MNEKTYEMMWDCEYCGARKLLGLTHRHCPECGAVQNPQKRYFPPDNEKVAVQDHQYVGADVHCPACREAQSARVKHCTNCGSPMSGGQAAHVQAQQVVGPGGMLQGQPGMQAGMPPAGYPGQMPAQPAEKKKGFPVLLVLGIVAVVAIVGFIIVAVVWKKDAAVEVTGHSWTREIAIERYESVKESGACKDMPKDADLIKRTKAAPVCKTRKIDNGDGTFKEKKECSEPVEQCSYKVNKWQTARTLKETGDGVDSTPRWPDVQLNRKGTCVGCEREGKRNEYLTVHFKDSKSGDKLTCNFDKVRWSSYAVGDSYKAKVSVITGSLDCDSLKKGK